MDNPSFDKRDLNHQDQLEATAFRPIQYLGSKLRLVREISEITEANKTSDLVCDLFAGSGVVSHYLAQSNTVISVDVQHYSTVISTALTNGYKFSEEEKLLFLNEVITHPVFEELKFIFDPLIEVEEALMVSELETKQKKTEFANFVEHCSVYTFLNSDYKKRENTTNSFVYSALRTFAQRFNKASDKAKRAAYCSFYYGGVYFSFRQSIIVDAILMSLNELKRSEPDKFAILLSSLLSTLSEIVSTVGKQFAQPMKLLDKRNKPKELLLQRSLRDRSYNVFDIYSKWIQDYSTNCYQDTNNFSVTSDFKKFLSSNRERKIGFIYADPPYTIDHYSRFYHILESIALYDYPKLAVMTKAKVGSTIMKGLYREDRYQSTFCIPSKVNAAFTDLFGESSKFNCPLLLSYSPFEKDSENRPRLLTIDQIVEIGNAYYRKAEVFEVKGHIHRKLNKAANNVGEKSNAEVLILFTH
jgi:adenine-specific DNA methylase